MSDKAISRYVRNIVGGLIASGCIKMRVSL